MTVEQPVQPPILTSREGAIARITLNRPRALNALTREMVVAVRDAVLDAELAGASAVLLDGVGDRGFCGGGDVKAMVSGGVDAALEFLREEYRADYAVAQCGIPVVGIMDGITMGGGIGLTGHASIRVVTERSRLAMPETRIGIVPDVGGNRLLANAPGRLGELLAMSSGHFGAGDAIALGFADAFVPSDRLDALRERLIRGEDPAAAVDEVAERPPATALSDSSGWFDAIAERALGPIGSNLSDPAAAALRLVGELERSDLDEARALAATIRTVSPTSVAVSLALLARVRAESLTLAEVLADDYRTLGRLMERPDFAEGVRAQLIEKDGAPRWSPGSLEELDERVILDLVNPAARAGESALSL